MFGPNKLEDYIILGWKGLPGTKTLAYWAHSLVFLTSRYVSLGKAILLL